MWGTRHSPVLPKWYNSKESTCQCRRRSFNPWVGKIPWRRKWKPTPVFLTGKSHGGKNLLGYSPWGRKELDMTERLSFFFLKHSLTTWPPKLFPFGSTTVLIAASTLSNSKYIHTASSTGPSRISNITHFPTLPYFSHSSLVSTSKSSSNSPAPTLFLTRITLVGHKYFS